MRGCIAAEKEEIKEGQKSIFFISFSSLFLLPFSSHSSQAQQTLSLSHTHTPIFLECKKKRRSIQARMDILMKAASASFPLHHLSLFLLRSGDLYFFFCISPSLPVCPKGGRKMESISIVEMRMWEKKGRLCLPLSPIARQTSRGGRGGGKMFLRSTA